MDTWDTLTRKMLQCMWHCDAWNALRHRTQQCMWCMRCCDVRGAVTQKTQQFMWRYDAWGSETYETLWLCDIVTARSLLLYRFIFYTRKYWLFPHLLLICEEKKRRGRNERLLGIVKLRFNKIKKNKKKTSPTGQHATVACSVLQLHTTT